ncbi:uncharacterized protein LOC110461046 isoform X2 [Mizuhopecten yessoensis]|uniref:uncharacterized protein LOC110461046 isoform X2 n=1 Tax=Mizuhopecten yessoensis TaxID=6573 RepID=UPI000B45A96B|nr:uncharacterized protein LOC110461046 isoform X2 [Mizuhopecten yessoensis]
MDTSYDVIYQMYNHIVTYTCTFPVNSSFLLPRATIPRLSRKCSDSYRILLRWHRILDLHQSIKIFINMDLVHIADLLLRLKEIGDNLLPHDMEKLHFICVGLIPYSYELRKLDAFSLLSEIATKHTIEGVVEALIRIHRIDLLNMLVQDQDQQDLARRMYSVLNTTHFDRLRVALLNIADNMTDDEDLKILKKVVETKIVKSSLHKVQTVLKLFDLLMQNIILDPNQPETVQAVFHIFAEKSWFTKVQSEYVAPAAVEEMRERTQQVAADVTEVMRRRTQLVAANMIEEMSSRTLHGAADEIEETLRSTQQEAAAAIEDKPRSIRQVIAVATRETKRCTQEGKESICIHCIDKT